MRDLPASLPTAAAFILGVLITCGWADPASARCAAFDAAGVPFYACAARGSGSFWLSARGQPAVRALRLDGDGGPFFLLSMDYEEGDRAGAWTASAGFVLTLRRGGAGPRRDQLAAEFCGPAPVPVRQGPEGPPEPRSCGQWTTLLDGSAFRSDVAVERRAR